MIIELDTSRKLEDVQNDFNESYPYLKLEFGMPTINNKSKARQKQMPAQQLTIGDVNKGLTANSIEITDAMPVAEAEKILAVVLDVPVKIMRKSGNIWMGTSLTNTWTLSQQNQHGKEISSSGIYLPNITGA